MINFVECDYLENGFVENREDFENIWKEDYPDSVKWYLLSVNHYNKEYFICMDSKLTLHIKSVSPDISESVNSQFISWINQAVNKCVDRLKKDTAGYNRYINQHLPYSRRTGRILRQQHWEIEPEEKEWMLKGLTGDGMDTLKVITGLSENEEQVVFPGKMTSGIFFDCCKMGYVANNDPYDTGLKPVDLYRKYADGRDGGLSQLNPDSPQAFEEWFNRRE
ncbi:MAG: hypothetical protein LBQ73_03130 [Tannerellaceae bacterium]|jgi:hypothetical protein|nr:hypothetical protein [Tannerellaceae bacterium]